MAFVIIILFVAVVILPVVLAILCLRHPRYDSNGFDKYGYDRDGFDIYGYNRYGYTAEGKNSKGEYNRAFDVLDYRTSFCSKDGFYDLRRYPIIVTTHAAGRMGERMRVFDRNMADQLANQAYQFGKSKRQIKKSSAGLVEEIESRHENGIVLIYRGYIYIFSKDNKLITVYKNDRIPL